MSFVQTWLVGGPWACCQLQRLLLSPILYKMPQWLFIPHGFDIFPLIYCHLLSTYPDLQPSFKPSPLLSHVVLNRIHSVVGTIWYDMIWDMIWYDIWYMRYDMREREIHFMNHFMNPIIFNISNLCCSFMIDGLDSCITGLLSCVRVWERETERERLHNWSLLYEKWERCDVPDCRYWAPTSEGPLVSSQSHPNLAFTACFRYMSCV